MRANVWAAVLVAILGITTAVDAQSRSRPASGGRASASSAGGASRRAPLGRGPGRSMPGRPSRPSAPAIPRIPPPSAAYQRVIDRSITTILRAGPGQVAAPRGATRQSMRDMFREAWTRFKAGGEGVSVSSSDDVGRGQTYRGQINTYTVDMNETTGRVTYPPGSRGQSQAFRHIVIQIRSPREGRESLLSFEPGPGPAEDARSVPTLEP